MIDEMMGGSLIKRERLHEQVTRSLALRILGGSFGVNGHSNTTEVELCRDLGVSRTVLREAVKVLAAKGLVEVRPKTGMRIRPRTDWKLIDRELMLWQVELGVTEEFVRNLYQVRLMLEPGTAAAAALHATAKDLAAIEAAYDRMERELNDFNAFLKDDCEFHERISAATHNDFLIQINRILLDALRGSQAVFRKERAGAKQALSLHRDVSEAILRKDADAAREAMTRLINQAEKNTIHVLRASVKSQKAART